MVSGLLWAGAPGQLIAAAQSGRVALVTSAEMLLELEDTLSRSKFHRQLRLLELSADLLLRKYIALCEIVQPGPLLPIVRDKNDDKVIATARGGNADIIVTGDKDLLVLAEVKSVLILNVRAAIVRVDAH